MTGGSPGGPDRLARLLEAGLAATVALAPWPFGAVRGGGRLAFEIAALALGALWTLRAARRTDPLPSKALLVAVLGLLALAAVQVAPLGEGAVGILSPRSAAIRDLVRPGPDAAAAEGRLLGARPSSFDRPAAISVDPPGTAAALRTGAALAALLLAAHAVGFACGPRRVAFGLLVGAAFQGLYGLLVLASGWDRIWNVPKTEYLDAATGTFVNRNHYASYLAAALPCGLALAIAMWRERRTDR